MTFDTVVHTETVTKYMRDGVLHRDDDLPAVMYKDGSCEWWVHGKRLRRNPHDPTEIRTFWHKTLTTRIWHDINGKFHRIDNPAIERFDGTKEWWLHGERRREHRLPTVETSTGWKMWHNTRGELHREGEPAVIGPGKSELWLDGRLISTHICQHKPPTSPT